MATERSFIPGRRVKPLRGFDAAEFASLGRIGIEIDHARQMFAAARDAQQTGMDALQGPTFPATIATPIQFLQNWLPGFVTVLTQARKIDELVGISITGAWEDELVIAANMELIGKAIPYGDYTNVPLSSWNLSFNERTVVRFEEGMQVGLLEEARAARVRVNSADMKREAASVALEIQRNRIGFFGFNAGANFTYGFLNDPNLPTYVVFPNGASASPLWSGKTYLEIVTDIRLMMIALRTQSGDNIDPTTTQLTLALSTATIDYLSVVSTFGNSVQDWLNKTYPNVRVVSAPELTAAHSGQNVAILYADSVADGSSDDGRTFTQMVPVKFKTLGVQQKVKSYEEDYGNATAGVMCKRPYAVVRYYGN